MLHVVFETDAPTTAPTEIGQHWFDVTNKKSYISVGTDDVDDWKETTSSGISGAYTGANLGSGIGVFAQLDGTQFQFRTLEAGPNIGIYQDGDTIVISGTASSSGTASGSGSDIGAVAFYGNDPNHLPSDYRLCDGTVLGTAAEYPDAVSAGCLEIADLGGLFSNWNVRDVIYDSTRNRMIAVGNSAETDQFTFAISEDEGQTWAMSNPGWFSAFSDIKFIVLANGDYIVYGMPDGMFGYSTDGGDNWDFRPALELEEYFSTSKKSSLIVGNTLVLCANNYYSTGPRIALLDITSGYSGDFAFVLLPDPPYAAFSAQVNSIELNVSTGEISAIGRGSRANGMIWTANISDLNTWSVAADPVIDSSSATITLTCTDNFSDGEQFHLPQAQWIVFRDSPSNPLDVQIGATLADSIVNLYNLITSVNPPDTNVYGASYDSTSITMETHGMNYAAGVQEFYECTAANASFGSVSGGTGFEDLFVVDYDSDNNAVVIITSKGLPNDFTLTALVSTVGGYVDISTVYSYDFGLTYDPFVVINGQYFVYLGSPSPSSVRFLRSSYSDLPDWTLGGTDFLSYDLPGYEESGIPWYYVKIGDNYYLYSRFGLGLRTADFFNGPYEVIQSIGSPATYKTPELIFPNSNTLSMKVL